MSENTMSNASELLPCPFCGSAPWPNVQIDDCPLSGDHAENQSGYYLVVWCEKCDAEGGKGKTEAEAIAAWNQRATPKPAGDLVERLDKIVRRSVMASVALGNWMSAALDDPKVCAAMKADIQEWFSAGEPELVQYARAAIAAMPDHAALVEEVETIRLSNSLLEQFRKSDLEELTNLRTQLAASRADVARLREAMKQIIALRVGSFSHSAPLATAMKRLARAAIKDTQP